MTAEAYFDVHKYRGQYAGAIDVVTRGPQAGRGNQRPEQRPGSGGRGGPGPQLSRRHGAASRLWPAQYWRRSSADLTQVLRLDPRAVVEPLEHDHLQITLIDPSRSLDDLIPIALTNRPELAAHQAEVQAALVRIRQEKLRPFLPILMLQGFQTPYEQLEFGVTRYRQWRQAEQLELPP